METEERRKKDISGLFATVLLAVIESLRQQQCLLSLSGNLVI